MWGARLSSVLALWFPMLTIMLQYRKHLYIIHLNNAHTRSHSLKCKWSQKSQGRNRSESCNIYLTEDICLQVTELHQHTFQGHLIICRFIISLCVYMAHACGQVWLTCPSFPCPLILSVGGIPPVHLCCPLPPQKRSLWSSSLCTHVCIPTLHCLIFVCFLNSEDLG